MKFNDYFYPDTDVLKNKFNIQDQAELEKKEANIVNIKLVNLDDMCFTSEINYDDLRQIHKYLFGDLYEWAGTERAVDMTKSEKVLSGLSVNYSNYKNIVSNGKKIIQEMNKIDWKALSNEEKVTQLTEKTAELWKNHSFREGNTRTTITFISAFAREKGFPLESSLFHNNPGYVRDSLVLASITNPENQYFKRILKAAIEQGEKYIQKEENQEPNKKDNFKINQSELNVKLDLSDFGIDYGYYDR